MPGSLTPPRRKNSVCRLDLAALQQSELTMRFVSGGIHGRIVATLKLMPNGRLQLRPLVIHLARDDEAPTMYWMIREETAAILGITLDYSKG